MIKFIKNPCNIYISLLAFYSMQGAMIPTGGTLLSQLILLVAMLMGLYYTAKAIAISNKPVYFSGLNLLFLMFIVYGTILLFSNHHYTILFSGVEVTNFSFLKGIFLSLPNIYTFYYFSRKGYLTEKALRKWAIVFLGIAIFRYFDYQIASVQLLLLNGSSAEEITNNMGYLFVALIPMIVVYKDKIRFQYCLLIVCMIFIVMGMKRGAIIVGSLSVVYFLYFNYKYNNGISKWKVIIFSFLIVIAAYFVTEYLMGTSDYFMSRIEQTMEGRSSGRDSLYEHFWNHFKNETDPLKFLFGNGANATLGIGVNYAHNDWLEIAINQGVLGLIVYGIYWVNFWRTIKATKYNKIAKLVLTLTFIFFFVKTLFSMSYSDYSMVVCSVFGYYLAHHREIVN